MKAKKAILKITAVAYLRKFILEIQFSDGSSQKVNFAPFLKQSQHPAVRKYLKLQNFKKYKLEQGELMWGDYDLIFPISDLYRNQIL